jgi:hypothetical protein
MMKRTTFFFGWAEKLGLNTDFHAAKVHALGELTCGNFGDPQDSAMLTSKIHSMTSSQFLLCNMPGRGKEDCQIFVYGVMAAHFATEDLSAAVKVLQDHKNFMCLYKGTGCNDANPRVHQITEPTKTDDDHYANNDVSAAIVCALTTILIRLISDTTAHVLPRDNSSVDSGYSNIHVPPPMLLNKISGYK